LSKKYKRKTVAVEAYQLTEERGSTRNEWPLWLQQAVLRKELNTDDKDPDPEQLTYWIGTAEGVANISWDDWVIKGPNGHLKSLKPDKFEAMYEPE